MFNFGMSLEKVHDVMTYNNRSILAEICNFRLVASHWFFLTQEIIENKIK